MNSFAFVFPGQGSQYVGMLDAWGHHPVVLDALREASDALGEDVAGLIREGPKELLALTTNTQPVMLVAAVAAYRVWMAETGVAPSVVAGHSLGEYSALVAAGVLTLTQAAPLVRFRAQAMQEAVPVGVGAMAAILGMEAAKVVEGCLAATQEFGADSIEVVEAVNFNDPLQTVIAGSGLIGQTLRVGPWSSEVITLADPEHAVPVQIARTGVRTLAVGSGRPGVLTLPFLPLQTDVRPGDRLLTSGLGGTFPAGYPVATVLSVRRDGASPLAQVEAVTAARFDRDRTVAFLWFRSQHSAAPAGTPPAAPAGTAP